MSNSASKLSSLSVIIPVSERFDSLPELVAEYAEALAPVSDNIDYTIIVDGPIEAARNQVKQIARDSLDIQYIELSRGFGESNALSIGFEKTTGEFILTLPAYRQVKASQLPELVESIDDHDVVVARRWPRHDSSLNQFMTRAFHKLIRWITRYDFRDLGCGVRLIRRRVLDEVRIYGDQHRFLPILAMHRGFSVTEKSINQSSRETSVRVYAPTIYFQRLLDIVTVFFLTRFTKKPLRFFGLVGGGLFLLGSLALMVIITQRFAMDIALGDRPAMVIATLMMVLGAQLIALGLVGELIIFANAKSDREYTIAEAINLKGDHAAE